MPTEPSIYMEIVISVNIKYQATGESESYKEASPKKQLGKR